jgi:cell wall-associated NlpC family hydrolase
MWTMLLVAAADPSIVLDARAPDPEARRSLRVRLAQIAREAGARPLRGGAEREVLAQIRTHGASELRQGEPCEGPPEGPWVLTADPTGWVLTGARRCTRAAGPGTPVAETLRAQLRAEPQPLPPPPLRTRAGPSNAPSPKSPSSPAAGDRPDGDRPDGEMAEMRRQLVVESHRHLKSVPPGALKRFAERMLGTPYQHPGEPGPGITPAELVRRLYLEVYGIDVGEGLYALLNNHPPVDAPVGRPMANLRPGDVVLTVTMGMRPRGVWVYLGRGKVVTSAMTFGVVVKEFPADQPEHRWIVARRPLAGTLEPAKIAQPSRADDR